MPAAMTMRARRGLHMPGPPCAAFAVFAGKLVLIAVL
jgi:hypothetical protein